MNVFEKTVLLNEIRNSKKLIDFGKICAEHNEEYSEIAFDDFRCLSCEKEKRKQKEIAGKKIFELSEAKQSLKLPKKLESYSFDNYTPSKESDKILKGCMEYVDNWPGVGGILMLGGVGTGKTHLAVSICKELRDRGTRCFLTTVNRIIRDVRSCWGGKRIGIGYDTNSSVTEEMVIAQYVEYGLLVIDEIGSQYGSESERIIINEIINDRYEMDRPTVIIGNVSISEASKILGTRVIDRIKDNGKVMFFEWESHRKLRG